MIGDKVHTAIDKCHVGDIALCVFYIAIDIGYTVISADFLSVKDNRLLTFSLKSYVGF